MAYLGNDLQVAFPVYRNIDDISGSFNSSTTSFPLRVNGVAPVPAPLYSQQCLISVGGVVQRPDDSGSEGFRLSGGNIIFASAPTTGADFFGVILAGADYINAGGNFPAGTAGVPSITFNDDLDTGIYNSGTNQLSITTGGSERLRIDSAGQIESVSLGTAAAPAFSFTSDPNTGIYSPGADQLAISTNGTGRLSIDANGNVAVDTNTLYVDAVNNRVGVGTTSPSAMLSLGGNLDFKQSSNISTTTGYLNLNPIGSLILDGGSGSAVEFRINTIEAARIDSSRRLLVGTSSARSNFYNDTNSAFIQLESASNDGSALALIQNFNANTLGGQLILAKSNATSVGSNTLIANNDTCGRVSFQGNDGTQFVEAAAIFGAIDGTPGANDMPGRLVFSTTADGASSPTERMRITNSGFQRIYSSAAVTHVSQSSSAAGTTNSLYYGSYGATDNQGTSAVNSYVVWSNGNVQNTNNSYTGISDIKLKENIVDANSQWDDIKALQVRKYNFKEGQTHTQIGLIAQEVELVSPGLVSESPDRDKDGNDLGTVTKSVNYSVLYMKAVKALQEAMERIETLEAKVAALETL